MVNEQNRIQTLVNSYKTKSIEYRLKAKESLRNNERNNAIIFLSYSKECDYKVQIYSKLVDRKI